VDENIMIAKKTRAFKVNENFPGAFFLFLLKERDIMIDTPVL